jgi:DNA (cytosine-5)-methyltransferase 1
VGGGRISDLFAMKVLDLFAGIGGFTLGLERAGFETVAFCEIEPYAQKVLRKNWPEVPIYDDVRTITADRLISDGIGVDVITGGFPCQDISVSGYQRGIEAERSGLWSECARLIGELRPRYAIFENVTNLLNGERGAWFKRVLWDISSLGYDAEWHCIPASELGAHHHRDRVWIICYPREVLLEDSRYGQWRDSKGTTGRQDAQRERECDTSSIERSSQDVANAERWRTCGKVTTILQQACFRGPTKRSGDCDVTGARQWLAEPDVGRVANGIPNRSHRLKCLGNAVVPPIPELIGRAIINHER